MFKFDSLQLSNYLLWDEVEFEFKPGTSFINGDNRSGKSLLVSPLKACLYDALDVPKGAKATFNLEDDRHSYALTAFNKGRTKNSFHIVRDGHDRAVETRDAALNLLHRYFGYHVQESLFDTTVSLSGLRKHPLADGKAAQRLDWVHETLAYASLLDGYIDTVEKQIKPARENAVRYDVLQDQLRSLTPVEEVRANVPKLQRARTKLNRRLEAINLRLREIERAQDFASNAPEEPEMDLASARKQLKRATATLAEVTERADVAEQRATLGPRYRKATDAYATAKDTYKALCEQYDRKVIDPAKAVEICRRALKEATAAQQAAQDQQRRWRDQADTRELAAQTPPLKGSAAKLTKLLDNLREEATLVKRTIASVRSGDSHCEVCGSDISARSHDLEELASQAAGFEKQIKRARLSLAIHEAREVELVPEPTSAEDLNATIASLEEIAAAAQQVTLAAERLESTPKPPAKVVFEARELQQAKARCTAAQEAVATATAYERALERRTTLEGNRYAGQPAKLLTQQHRKLSALRTDASERLQTIAERLVQAETNSALRARWESQHTELTVKAEPFAEAAVELKVLLALRKGLGRDGYRTKRLENTLELFVDNLNDLAPLLWNEPFKFEIETGPRKCDVVVHRNGIRGNAFTFSGSEQRSWQLVAGLAMLRLLPANRRCDTIILDELEANMSALSRARFLDNFLPEIQRTVPNVVIVSPLGLRELVGFKPDHGFRVEKRKNRSTLNAL